MIHSPGLVTIGVLAALPGLFYDVTNVLITFKSIVFKRHSSAITVLPLIFYTAGSVLMNMGGMNGLLMFLALTAFHVVCGFLLTYLAYRLRTDLDDPVPPLVFSADGDGDGKSDQTGS